MAKDFLTEFLPDLEEFRQKTRQFHNGEITTAQYKGFSGGFGSYAQRGGKTHMLRLRMAGGRLTRERLGFVIDSCEKYQIKHLKITTCQSLQIHDLPPSILCSLMAEAWRAGMISRGGGGDFPRNVMATPLSGVRQDEIFDVMPFAEAAGEYLMHFIKAVKFPRKLKVCFSNSPENETHATFRDLGFVAKPDRTFDVYAAGGLGVRPLPGICVAQNAAPENILYYIKAMVEVFVSYGNFENRGKARTRFLQETLGAEGLTDAYQKALDKIYETEQLSLKIEETPVKKRGTGKAPFDPRLLPQKQEELYSVFYQPPGGSLSCQKAKKLYQLIQSMDNVEIRLTPQEGMYLINCNAKEAQDLLEETKDGASTLFETSVACVGASVCQVGIGDSKALLDACIEAVRRENFPDGTLPRIHISGCPSSCGAHQIGEIGFRGGVKQTPEGPRPAFAIFEGGCPYQGREILAETGKLMAASDIPDFLIELGRLVASENTTYDKWILNHHRSLSGLIAKYTA